jgi:hypothetical protein
VDLAVGALDRDLHRDLAVGLPEHGAEVIGQLEALDGAVEVVADDVEVGDLRVLAGLVRAGCFRVLLGLLDGLGTVVSPSGVARLISGLRLRSQSPTPPSACRRLRAESLTRCVPGA